MPTIFLRLSCQRQNFFIILLIIITADKMNCINIEMTIFTAMFQTISANLIALTFEYNHSLCLSIQLLGGDDDCSLIKNQSTEKGLNLSVLALVLRWLTWLLPIWKKSCFQLMNIWIFYDFIFIICGLHIKYWIKRVTTTQSTYVFLSDANLIHSFSR